jgi:hypothetical protein
MMPQDMRALAACQGQGTPIFSPSFPAVPGSSGVATGADAAAGKINSEGSPSSAGVAGAGTFARPGAAAGVDAAPTPVAATTPPAASPASTTSGMTAMVVSCGMTSCAAGQVAVVPPPRVGSSPGTVGTGALPGAVGAPAPGVAAAVGAVGAPAPGGAAAVSAVDSTAIAPGSPAPSLPSLAAAGTLVCTDPPPPCPTGQSPQFTARGAWECTTCALVVTYGGLYGNYRRCVNVPTIVCPSGQSPTWVFENDAWACRTTCDNGQYDQHLIQGALVCVPC